MAMATDDVWNRKARGLLKAELKRREVSYPQLAEMLQALGIQETTASITNKISRGAFTAAFLLQCMEAIGCHTVRLEDG
jgi:3-mercaptopyruvate sulfurtransferase SseA